MEMVIDAVPDPLASTLPGRDGYAIFISGMRKYNAKAT
jgi:hypothetical protein